MKYLVLGLVFFVAACAPSLSYVDITKAEHLCRNKGALIDKISVGLTVSTVKCTDGKWYDVSEYNPHAKNDS